MGIIQTIKNIFKRSNYVITNQSLNSITDHPKIAISPEEYNRILDNLRYFAGAFDRVTYRDSNGTQVKRDFNHLPIGRTASKKVASLVFNEHATIQVDNETADEFVNETPKNDRFSKNFERYLESCLALGGLAMRPYIDEDRVRVSFVQAPVFLPLQSNTQDVSSAAIVTKTLKTEGQKVKYYSLIEFHEWTKDSYTITNELYESESNTRIGQRVPLNVIYEDLQETVTLNGLQGHYSHILSLQE